MFSSRSHRGMALVITLILLSVITFLAVTFLVVSRREKGAVVTMTDQTTARLAADAALESAKARLLVPMLANTNSQLFDLVVSTNFVNLLGFNGAGGIADRTNVNYDHLINGGVLSQDDFRQNIANLLYSPRAPVFVQTNGAANMPLDFRFYLDLNRNHRFDTNGLLPVFSANGQYLDTNGNETATVTASTLRNSFVGDPEWIGILEKPDQPHSSSNRFVARYAYIAVPSGKTLDVNYIHNQAFDQAIPQLDQVNDRYFRNQGVGTWEINLAAFLCDLNTNQWDPILADYRYQQPGTWNQGRAFEDAFSILTNRYAGNYNTLTRAQDLFANNAAAFQNDGIDEYSDGSIITPSPDNDLPANKWVGSDNTNHYFTTQDFFDPAKLPAGLVGRLQNAGAGVSSYDRYTFYRMLAQLGTDTGTDTRLNLNYVNVDAQGRTIPNMTTNLVAWTNALQFFTNAADRLLRTYTTNWFNAAPANYMYTFFNADMTNAFRLTNVANVVKEFGLTNAAGEVVLPTLSMTNIPVWVSNRFVYTPSVHRLLQLAANIYDATTNRNEAGYPNSYPYLPHVFRPVFRKEIIPNTSTNVYIVGYTGVEDANTIITARVLDLQQPLDLNLMPDFRTSGIDDTNDLIHGVPLIIGAKKGLPNFNEFAIQNTTYVARRLEFRHRNIAVEPTDTQGINPLAFTNQLYSVGVSNAFGFEAWNSYAANYPRALRMIVSNDLTIVLYETNGVALNTLRANRFFFGAITNIDATPANTWTGITNDPNGNVIFPATSFVVPLITNFVFFETNIAFLQSFPAGFAGVAANRQDARNGSANGSYPISRWWMKLSSRVRYILLDTSLGATQNRIVDYVTLTSDEPAIDVTHKLMEGVANPVNAELDPSDAGQWVTNRVGNSPSPSASPIGLLNQILVGIGQISPNSGWNNANNDFPSGFDKQKAIAFFKFNLTGVTNDSYALYRSNVFTAPYVPIRTIVQHITWQANDPLVHYTLPDLTVTDPKLNGVDFTPANPALKNIRDVNDHYQPWAAAQKGQPPGNSSQVALYANPANKDPLVYQSDNWEFPINKLPNIGWLGRVHRGTPWQTIYMKSPDFPVADWSKWTGDTNYVNIGNIQFLNAARTLPLEDRTLFDLFTTSVNENAGRGQLSVNQSGLAAWSAILSGVITLTNAASDNPLPNQSLVVGPFVIEPAGYAGNSSPVGRIVRAINDVRATNVVLFPDHTFQHVGDVLSVPELTVNSPFLHFDPNGMPEMPLYGISDAMYERIPQQIMSLLRSGEPRFVIYAYGQALRPAPNSVIMSGSFFGMCTNYQVVAEVATRTVMRVEGAPTLGMTNATPRLMIENFNVLGPD